MLPPPCLQPPPPSQHCPVQAEAVACSPRPLQPLLRPRFQGPKRFHAEAYAEPVPSAKKSAGAPKFLEFHGGFGEGGLSWCSWGTHPVSRFNVFGAASSARRTVDKAVEEAIQDNFAVEKARVWAEVEAEAEAQVKAAAKASAKPRADVQAKRKSKDGDEQDDGEDYVEDEDEDDDDEYCDDRKEEEEE